MLPLVCFISPTVERTFVRDEHQNTTSGLKVVVPISGFSIRQHLPVTGCPNWLCSGIVDLLLVTLVYSRIKVVACRGLDTEDVLELVAACLVSRVVTRLFRTWLWHQELCPWAWLTLHPVRMGLRDAGCEQGAQLGSSHCHSWRFAGVGRSSYVTPITKLSCLYLMRHWFFQLSFLLSALSLSIVLSCHVKLPWPTSQLFSGVSPHPSPSSSIQDLKLCSTLDGKQLVQF